MIALRKSLGKNKISDFFPGESTYLSDGETIHRWSHLMKIPVATLFLSTFFYFSCHCVLATDVNNSWKVLGQAKVQKKLRNGTMKFRPELSLEENNTQIESYRSQSVSVVASLPLQARDDWKLVNRSVQFHAGSNHFGGRITAVMIGADSSVTVFAQVDCGPEVEHLEIPDGFSGYLSIGE
jgi:hypothetical protein